MSSKTFCTLPQLQRMYVHVVLEQSFTEVSVSEKSEKVRKSEKVNAFAPRSVGTDTIIIFVNFSWIDSKVKRVHVCSNWLEPWLYYFQIMKVKLVCKMSFTHYKKRCEIPEGQRQLRIT